MGALEPASLNEIFDLSEINWKDIEINLQNSLIKEVCEYWNIHKHKEWIGKTANKGIFMC